ncbi:MAG: NADPH-dependent assimilatory sulfite reductase hemoprotein subunit [Candidatus Didemnitutus sp.]|nr:NADPH-dependent assimilatory sulfite reductase hemoprotein subunit [Candidatus Didemnitutus sp.]
MSENSSASTTPALSKNELLKQNDPSLAGDMAATLADPALDRFSADDEQFIKFHGIYQQDDRDRRKTGKHYQFMIRNRVPGGIVPPEQYLVFDDLATRYGNDTLRITSRQAFQWHGVVKTGLGPLMRRINEVLSTTLAACGDVARNVMAPATPATSVLVEQVLADARLVSEELLPRATAYHQIWVDGTELNLAGEREEPRTTLGPDGQPLSAPPPAEGEGVSRCGAGPRGAKPVVEDALYGRTYLPRKFKTAFAIPPLNDTDVFTNCLGFVAIVDPAHPEQLLGYNLLAGGGLGMSHGNKETFPRLADVIGFFPCEGLVAVAKAVLTAHRDFGDRTNRKHARLKYVLEERGANWFRGEVEVRAGFKLDEARPMNFQKQGDLFGWHQQADGSRFLGLYVEAGRVKNTPERQLKIALRRIVEKHRIEVRLTPSQNLLLTGVRADQQADITAILAEHGVPVENQAAAVRRASMACPSMPTCGLGLAESERFLPSLLDQFEHELATLGLADEEIIVRMTGCPNGCARPYMAEIGFVGRAPNKYNVYLGGNETSMRLNREFRASVKSEEIMNELRPVLLRWRDERQPGERFGDFAMRTVLAEIPAPATA